MTEADPILRVQGVKKYFNQEDESRLSRLIDRVIGARETNEIKAVDGVSFEVCRGETYGLVGESGCGKSTTAEVVANLLAPTAGQIEFDFGDGWIESSDPTVDDAEIRREVQMVFQDPQASLNPRRKIGPAIRRPLDVHDIGPKAERDDRVIELLEAVGLTGRHYQRYPHEISGGQQQRVAIARALSVDPTFLILDEPTSALDVSIQGQILNLLKDLQTDFDVTYLFISHDMSVIEYMADRVAVMYLGEIVETGPIVKIFDQPSHPYLISLLSAIPQPDPGGSRAKVTLKGDVPSPTDPPSGCRFHNRCPAAIEDECRQTAPDLRQVPGDDDGDHQAACHLLETEFDFGNDPS